MENNILWKCILKTPVGEFITDVTLLDGRPQMLLGEYVNEGIIKCGLSEWENFTIGFNKKQFEKIKKYIDFLFALPSEKRCGNPLGLGLEARPDVLLDVAIIGDDEEWNIHGLVVGIDGVERSITMKPVRVKVCFSENITSLKK